MADSILEGFAARKFETNSNVRESSEVNNIKKIAKNAHVILFEQIEAQMQRNQIDFAEKFDKNSRKIQEGAVQYTVVSSIVLTDEVFKAIQLFAG